MRLTFEDTILDLRNPVFNDSKKLQTNMTVNTLINSESMMYDTADYFDIETYLYTFNEFIIRKDPIRVFLELTLGKRITILDYKNLTYTGVIINSPITFEDIDYEMFTFNLEILKC